MSQPANASSGFVFDGELKGHTGEVLAVAVSPNGGSDQVATAAEDGGPRSLPCLPCPTRPPEPARPPSSFLHDCRRSTGGGYTLTTLARPPYIPVPSHSHSPLPTRRRVFFLIDRALCAVRCS